MNNTTADMAYNVNLSSLNQSATPRSTQSTTPVSVSEWHRALTLIDISGVVNRVEEWSAEDGAAGRSVPISTRHVLAAGIVLALEGQNPTPFNVTGLLHGRLIPTTRELLGLPESFAEMGRSRVYVWVLRVATRISDTMDAYPLSTRRGAALTKREREGIVAVRQERSVELEAKRRRFVELANRLVGAQYEMLPARYRAGRVSVAIGARFRSANAHGISPLRQRVLSPDASVSVEPDAAFHVSARAPHARPRTGYGWEDELAVLIPNDPSRADSVPPIVIGFNSHRPAHGLARSACEVLQHIAEHGPGLDHVVLDRAYMNTRPELLRAPLHTLGAKLVGDYALSRLGLQDAVDGRILVEGTWYDASMPELLQNAVKAARGACAHAKHNSDGTPARLDDLIAARAAFALRPKDPTGAGADMVRGEQHYPYQSPRWRAVHTAGRRAIKEHLTAEDTYRSRAGAPGVRGATTRALFSVFNVIGTNAQIIRDFEASFPTIDRRVRHAQPRPVMITRTARTVPCPHKTNTAGVAGR